MAKNRKGKKRSKSRSKAKRRRILARVTRDNKITKKERRKLQKAGISSNKTRNYQINKSRPKTINLRKKAKSPASYPKTYVPLKIKGRSGGWDGGGKNSRGGSGGYSNADRSSGEFNDIKNALREDARAGEKAAERLREREVEQANSYQQVIADLQAQTRAIESASEQRLQEQAQASAASLANLNDLFVGQMNDVESRMAQQQEDFNTAQAFANEQLNAANNAFLAEQKRSANMGNAYVPQANPNAFSIGYGDGRTATRRKRQDNQLSDLTLLTGLGTISSPLAGLQLA